jgi:hypothetical protein
MSEIGDYSDDIKEGRKETGEERRSEKKELASQAEVAKQETLPKQEELVKVEELGSQENVDSQPRCWDWIVVSGSCHYAKDRSPFKTYRQVQGTAQGMTVIGIGTVELQALRSPDNPGSHTLVLEDVLHIPSAICNGFNPGLYGGLSSWQRSVTQGIDKNDMPIWYGKSFCGVRRLELAGNTQGESELEKGEVLMLSIYLTKEEQSNLFPEE